MENQGAPSRGESKPARTLAMVIWTTTSSMAEGASDEPR